MYEIKVEGEARIALETNRTIRCLCKRRYGLESRRSRDAKVWADQLADKTCQSIMQDLGRDASAFTKQVLMIQLRRNHAYFCFDVFFRDGSEQPSNDICHKIDQPIYRTAKSGDGVYSLQRNKTAERIFGLQYSEIQEYDRGGLPYFQDMFRPAFYDDGILVDDPEELVTADSETEESLRSSVDDNNEVGDDNAKSVDGQT